MPGALKYVHSHSILHLDIKPSNIMIDDSDDAILIDFGTAKQYDEDSGENTSTLMGKTPGYAPLEQMGNDVVTFTPATDIYAIGATFYKLLTGITPLGAHLLASGDTLAPLPSSISPSVATAITAAMSLRLNARPQSIDAFLSLLDKATEGDGDEVTVLDSHPKAPKKPKSNEPDNTKTSKTRGYINGHEWVDLGLSVKWATCNIGADNPSDYGDYFAWGETKTKSAYTVGNSKTDAKSMGSICGDAQYDAATAHWCGSWRLPTKAEIEELTAKCTWTWTTQGGHNGYKVTGKNGKSIFLPAAGGRNGTWPRGAGTYGYYSSGTPYGGHDHLAYFLYLGSDLVDRGWGSRPYGRSVRPVSE